MTTGQEWQFKPYKWNEPKELFHHGASSLSPLVVVVVVVASIQLTLPCRRSQSRASTRSGRPTLRTPRSRPGTSASSGCVRLARRRRRRSLLAHELTLPHAQQVDKSKRHTDKSTVADFWRTLESWIAVHKPWVAY